MIDITIPYWFGRKLTITGYRVNRRGGKMSLMITPMFRDKELSEHCNSAWFYKRWWFLDLPF